VPVGHGRGGGHSFQNGKGRAVGLEIKVILGTQVLSAAVVVDYS